MGAVGWRGHTRVGIGRKLTVHATLAVLGPVATHAGRMHERRPSQRSRLRRLDAVVRENPVARDGGERAVVAPARPSRPITKSPRLARLLLRGRARLGELYALFHVGPVELHADVCRQDGDFVRDAAGQGAV